MKKIFLISLMCLSLLFGSVNNAQAYHTVGSCLEVIYTGSQMLAAYQIHIPSEMEESLYAFELIKMTKIAPEFNLIMMYATITQEVMIRIYKKYISKRKPIPLRMRTLSTYLSRRLFLISKNYCALKYGERRQI